MRRTSRYIVVRSKESPEKVTKGQRVAGFLHSRAWTHVGPAEWAALRESLPDISLTTLRAGLKESGLIVEQPWRGVEQHTLQELADSLKAMSAAYETGDPLIRQAARTEVITAKDRARFASRNAKVDPEKRALKVEMVEWMLVWLGDPALFPAWVTLRLTRSNSAGIVA